MVPVGVCIATWLAGAMVTPALIFPGASGFITSTAGGLAVRVTGSAICVAMGLRGVFGTFAPFGIAAPVLVG
jgi:hypothetical protein